MRIVVRAYSAEDHDALVRLWSSVFADDPVWNDPKRLIARKLQVQGNLLLVACCEDELAGALMAGFDGVRGWLHHLAVDPCKRRLGIGRMLVNAAEAGLRDLGCDKLNLQIRAGNDSVIAFYSSLGFSIESRISMGRRI